MEDVRCRFCGGVMDVVTSTSWRCEACGATRDRLVARPRKWRISADGVAASPWIDLSEQAAAALQIEGATWTPPVEPPTPDADRLLRPVFGED